MERPLEETVNDYRPNRRYFDAASTAAIDHDGNEDIEIGLSVWFRGRRRRVDVRLEREPVRNFHWDSSVDDPDGVWIELTGRHTEGAESYPTYPPAPS